MRKFTIALLGLFVLAFAFPLVAVSQEEETPIYYDSEGYIIDAPDHVRLDVPVVDRNGGAKVTCNIPEVRFTGLAEEVFPSTTNRFTARVYSHGLQEDLNGVYYDTYYKQSENDEESVVSSISDYGTISFNIRIQSSDSTDVNITTGSGLVGFDYTVSLVFFSTTYHIKAMSLGIVDNYCISRNRPLNFKYRLDTYGIYRMHYKIVHCTNSKSSIPTNGYTANGAECCGIASKSDYYAQSCTWSESNVLYETDMYMRVVSTKIHAHPQGGTICQGQSHTLSVNAETCLTNGLTYQWYRWNNGEAELIEGATSSTYNATEAGEYYCVTNDGREPRETEHATVNVTPMPQVTLAADQTMCPGGSVDLAMPEGATYSWNGGSTAQTLNVTEPGTYTVTMTANGCTAAHSFNVESAPAVNLAANDPVDFCYGTTATLELIVDNAEDIVWNNNAENNQSTFVVNEAGTYPVTAVVNGCTFTDEVVAVMGDNVNLVADNPVTFCYGETETLSLIPNNATNIVWNNDQANNATSFVVSESGTYPVSAVVNGCTYTDEVVATQGENVNLIELEQQQMCNGGSITLELAVDNAENIVWNNDPSLNSATLNVSETGTYNVAADVNGCHFTDQIEVVSPQNYDLISAESVVICEGSTRTLSVLENATNVVWNGSIAQNTLDISEAGTYTVTADVNGCSYSDQIVATISDPMLVSVSADEISCNGGTTTAEANVTGGTSPYTYEWSNAAISQNITVGSGSYNLTVIDANECTATVSTTIVEPEIIVVSINAGTIACNGGTATLEASAIGGTPGYNYEWNNGAATQGITAEAGTYIVTVTDAKNCNATAETILAEPAVLEVSVSAGLSACSGGTTTAMAIVTGGTEDYTYIWNNGGTTQTLADIAAGNYSVTVTDANGCTASASAAITEPQALAVSLTAEAILCNGGTATVEADAIGGTPAYSYAWNNQETASAITAVAGEYIVTVTDLNGCTATATTVITEPVAIEATIAVVNTISCNGETDATVNVQGGVEPYSYTWSNGAASQVASLTSGDYSVTVTDANGCTVAVSETITLPTALSVEIAAGTIACNGETTTAEANVAGGTEPYAFVWSNGETTQAIANMLAGEYGVTVTDANGCIANGNVIITEPEVVNLITEETVSLCDGASVVVTLVDGATNILWDNDDTGISHEIFTAGVHSVSADVDGCHYNDQVVVEVEELPSLELVEEYSYNITRLDTIITILAAEGFASYLWSNGSTESSFSISCDTIDFPYSQEVSLTVASESGCTMTQSFTLAITYSPSMIDENEGMSWCIAPNPNNGVFDILGPEYDRAEVFASDGRKVCEINGARQDLSNLKPGVYSIKIFAGEEISVIRFMISK